MTTATTTTTTIIIIIIIIIILIIIITTTTSPPRPFYDLIHLLLFPFFFLFFPFLPHSPVPVGVAADKRLPIGRPLVVGLSGSGSSGSSSSNQHDSTALASVIVLFVFFAGIIYSLAMKNPKHRLPMILDSPEAKAVKIV